jgi:hypothetical protein
VQSEERSGGFEGGKSRGKRRGGKGAKKWRQGRGKPKEVFVDREEERLQVSP